jgi:Gly-Xaa carboxypeptidase
MYPLTRQDITQENVTTLFESKDFQDSVARRLSEAVQIPTITYDSMGSVGKDPRWEVFFKFSDYLKKTFPQVYAPFSILRAHLL